MSSSQTPSGANPLDVPPWLELIYKWSRVLAIPVIIGAAVAGYFGREDEARILGYLSAFFFCALYFAILFIRNNVQANQSVEKILSTAEFTKAEERDRAVRELKRSRRFAQFVTIFLLVVAAGSLVLPLYQPISYKLRPARP